MDAQLIILVVGAMGAAIAFWTIREDKQNKKIKKLAQGWREFSVDRDGDGLVQEGTPFERKVAKPKPKAKPKAKPVKKAVAKKKAAPAKKKKAVPLKKKVKKAPVKKKAVAKKKSR